MTTSNIQVSGWKVKGQAYSQYIGEGGISVSQTSIFLTELFAVGYQVSDKRPLGL